MLRWRKSKLAVCCLCLFWMLAPGCNPLESPLTFTVTFEDAQQLEEGDDVVYKGVAVGRVTNLSIEPGGPVRVEVEIDPEHRQALYQEALFSVARAPGASGLTGGRQLEILDREGPRTQLQDGAVIEGSEGRLERAADSLKEAWKAAREAAGELGAGARELASEFRDAPETREFVESLEEFATEAEDVGREQMEELRDEGLPELSAKAREVRDRLLADGRREEALEFWRKFSDWVESNALGPPPPAEAEDPATPASP